MSRPKGSNDVIKRRKRNQFGFGSKEANQIRSLRNQHLTFSEIETITGLSYAQIKKICKDFDIKTISSIELYKKSLVNFNLEQCGIYVIEIRQKNGYVGYYIGSSTNIGKRYKNHLASLNANNHYNAIMQSKYNDRLSINCYIWSLEDEDDLLFKESKMIASYCGLYNGWRNIDIEEVKKELLIAAEKFTEDKYTINNSGCWEWNIVDYHGYGKSIQVAKRHFKPHRISLFKYSGEYPELVRHKCNNRRCVNPKHLEGGSCRENAKDKQIWELSKKIG